MEHLLCVSSHRCLSPFVIILVNCPNPGVRFQSKPRKLRLREVQTAVQDHLALDRQPSLDLPRDLPIHACFPLANGQEKLPALSIVHCFSPTPVSNFRLNSTNQTNQKEKKKKKHLLVKPLCSVPSRDSGFFFGKSAGGGGPAREKVSPFYSLWPSQGNISEAGCFGGPSPCCSPLPFPRAPGRAEGAPVLVNAS